MKKKSGRVLHITLIAILSITATFITFKNSDILANVKTLSAASDNGHLQNKNGDFGSSDIAKESIIAEQEPAAPAPSPVPESLPTAESSTTTTASPSNSSSDITANKTAKTSPSTSSGAKNQKVTAAPKPTPKPAAYTINSNGKSYSISTEERNLFARLVSAEAVGESYEGKLAVATVVINRVVSGVFPGSITQVIMGQEGGYYQFTPILDGRINNPASTDAVKAVDQILGGYRSFSPKIMWFLNPQKSTSGWIIKNKTYFKTIGNHDFYY